jgi:hypothetical protein
MGRVPLCHARVTILMFASDRRLMVREPATAEVWRASIGS